MLFFPFPTHRRSEELYEHFFVHNIKPLKTSARGRDVIVKKPNHFKRNMQKLLARREIGEYTAGLALRKGERAKLVGL